MPFSSGSINSQQITPISVQGISGEVANTSTHPTKSHIFREKSRAQRINMSTTNQRSVKGSGSVRTWLFRLMTARGCIKYSLAVRFPRDCLNCSPLHDTSHTCFSRSQYNSPRSPCFDKYKRLLIITYPINRDITGCHITTIPPPPAPKL